MTDFVTVFVFLVGFVIVLLTAMVVGTQMFDSPLFVDATNTSESGMATLNAWQLIKQGGMDNWFLAAYFLIHIGLFVMAGLLPVFSTAFLAINLVYVVILGVVASMLGDVFPRLIVGFSGNNSLVNFGVVMPKMTWVFNHFLTLEVVWLGMMVVVVYMVQRRLG